ncbi:NADPH-dependent F420 reductase [Horticoccus sp. 23ND18S-11]|uniref:NADPH-dependent F420 reductase n=1 Tax=Horticoccus sp. 23ND18S-11 TaxID=3391832 RepID=UPI0039C941C4
MKTTTIAILGNGNVGGALARGLARSYSHVQSVGHDQAAQLKAATQAEIIILAVPFPALDAVVKNLGSALDGKVVVDATNALTPDYQLAVGFTTSGAEELQQKLPRARVVKAFNTVFAQHLDTGKVGATTLTALVSSDDAAAKQIVITLAQDLGFEAVDAGPLKNARLLEPVGFLNIQLGYMLGLGTQIGFKLVRG